MDVRPSSGRRARAIDANDAVGRAYDADQVSLPGSVAATDARALGLPPGAHVYPPAGAVAWDSDLMSIRHPVSRAASRAFCPSFPIASESW
jgi:hypothetical protein